MSYFDFYVDFAKANEANGKLYLEGVASTSNPDLQNDIISQRAIAKMAEQAPGLPLTTSHHPEVTDDVGTIMESRVEDGNLYIKAELEPDHPMASVIYKRVASGRRKIGFSVGGKITRVLPGLGKAVKRVIDDVDLNHVMVTQKPANPDTFAVALSKALDTIPDADVISKEETMENQTAEDAATLDKAGAKYSADTKAALKDIHDSGNDVVKSKVRAMLGDDADDVLGAAQAAGSATDDSAPVGVAEDSAPGSSADIGANEGPSITKQFAEIKDDVIAAVRAEIASALAKSNIVKEDALEKAEDALSKVVVTEDSIYEAIRKSIG